MGCPLTCKRAQVEMHPSVLTWCSFAGNEYEGAEHTAVYCNGVAQGRVQTFRQGNRGRSLLSWMLN